jgi:hypothetical protein
VSASAGQFGIPPLPPQGLRRFVQPQALPPQAAGPRCEMCGGPVPPHGEYGHGHVVNLEARGVMCTCRPCTMLFEPTGAGQGKYRAVPDRHLYDPEFALSDGQWDALQVPVRMAFFFYNSVEDRLVAFYPSPAGATESKLPLETWRDVMDANPAFGDVMPDVEALLLFRGADAGFECFLVPITACYELVGRVRMHWRGFDGGKDAWEQIDAFFQRLRDVSKVVGTGRTEGQQT